jgi:hypothetical protein
MFEESFSYYFSRKSINKTTYLNKPVDHVPVHRMNQKITKNSELQAIPSAGYVRKRSLNCTFVRLEGDNKADSVLVNAYSIINFITD